MANLEMVPAQVQGLIENLLNVHALANMYRANNHPTHAKGAMQWLPVLERQFRSLRESLTPDDSNT